MTRPAFNMDLSKQFPHLAAAPIVEAVIQWNARAQLPFEPDALQKRLESLLPGYPNREPQYHHEFLFQGLVAENQPQSTSSHQGGWHGFRVSTADKHYIAQITRDGLVLSRLHPYEDWQRFSAEALRVWKVYLQLAAPSEVQRLGVRFINRIASARIDTLNEYLNEPPTCPMPLKDFLYQSTYEVPGQPFLIRVVKTMQAGISGASEESGLILDIDVGTTKAIACDEEALREPLSKMRWLKNKFFFDLLTDSAIESFKGG
ncbi:MAG: TIGR04255 family protein [Gemmataceae bacterium]